MGGGKVNRAGSWKAEDTLQVSFIRNIHFLERLSTKHQTNKTNNNNKLTKKKSPEESSL